MVFLQPAPRNRTLPLIGLLTLCCACGEQSTEPGPNHPTGYNVILVTLDGVRWQEFFQGSDPLLTSNPGPVFPLFWNHIAARGRVYGDPLSGSTMNVATASNSSLPGYTSIYAEVEQGCDTNYCRRIKVPTFVDRLKDELWLGSDQLAVYAAWWKMNRAVTGRNDVAQVHANEELPDQPQDPEPTLTDASFDYDRSAAVGGFEYLDQHHPRFLHLGLLDSDRYGHQNRYEEYTAVLRAYDRLLDQLVDRLDAAGDYGRKTALIVTTDHGRGVWDQWAEHGPQIPESGRVWAFVMLPPDATGLTLVSPDARTFDHHDVRYTIEAVFGLGTRDAEGDTGFVAPPPHR